MLKKLETPAPRWGEVTPARACVVAAYLLVVTGAKARVVPDEEGPAVPPDLGEIDSDTLVALVQGLLDEVGDPHQVMHPADVVNAMIAQQELGARRTREEVVRYATRQWAPSHVLAARVQRWEYSPDLKAVGLGEPE